MKTIKAINNYDSYKGVFWRKDSNKWRTGIMFNGKAKHLGCFTDLVEAAQAYDKAALRLFGEFARLNFPGA